MFIYLKMSLKYDLFKSARIQKMKSVFNVKETYKHAKEWLEFWRYDVVEKKYKHKEAASGREIEIDWICTREIDEYTQFMLDIRWLCLMIKDVKVQVGNKKITMQHGEINVFISAYLVLDWQNKWEESAVMKFLRSFFEKYLYQGHIQSLKEQLWKEGWAFYNEMKAYLNMHEFELKEGMT